MSAPIRLALVVAAAVALAGLTGLAVDAHAADSGDAAPSDAALVHVGDDALWPYTSRTRSVAGRTLAVNVLVHGDTDGVRRTFLDRDWERGGDSQLIPWRSAHGATRFTYAAVNGSGRWLSESFQANDGSYFGSRLHVRGYTPASANWTAVQAHEEYWDWFRLRHTVVGVDSAQSAVADDLRMTPGVARVTHRSLGNAGRVNGDGVATVVVFAVPLLGSLGWFRRVALRRGLLVAALPVALVATVRVGAVAVDGAFVGVPPKAVAALLYPVLALVLPWLTARLARPLSPLAAFLAATVGGAAAFALDLLAVGVTAPPVGLLTHRVSLALALGLLAAAVADSSGRSERTPTAAVFASVVVWGLVLLRALFGL
ncbi:hypothetical protein GCM10009037_17540 [Halarchaeum grantii]|uniref:Uncharacterized protein n=1 Tax=Halarchaeum grantii TaxID=1193105 RepID=A0A830EVQ7_9EURY|nr:hypothetical protein [Halarchaeum grantii]GGL34399.1 hypothetical protein GCM10009037_17540 [Halarchaeum grantii]